MKMANKILSVNPSLSYTTGECSVMYCVPLNNIVISKYLMMVIVIMICFQQSRDVGDYVILGCKRYMLVNQTVFKNMQLPH
jgi:hypothetical protein